MEQTTCPLASGRAFGRLRGSGYCCYYPSTALENREASSSKDSMDDPQAGYEKSVVL